MTWWPFLLAPAVAFGWVAARRVFVERDNLSAGVGAVSLALAFLLLGVNLLLPYLSMTASLAVSTGVLGVAAGVMVSRPARRRVWRTDSVWTWLGLALSLGAAAAWCIYALADAQVIEGDFFIHAAQFGLFQGGRFPPEHPFYPSIPLHGHYGRPLMVAMLAGATGMADLEAEWVLTLALQLLTLLLLFTAFRRAADDAMVGLGAAGFAFFAVNVGYRTGLMDTLQNHNSAAWFFVALVAWCVLPLLVPQEGRETEGASAEGPEPVPGVAAAVVAGLVLGISQFVYETNFGLQWLALALLALASRWRWEPERRPPVGLLGIVLAVSLALACVEGGAVTSMAAKRLGLGAPVASATQAAGQEVGLRIPKEKLFQVRLSNLTPAKPFETKFRPWKPDGAPTDEYAPLWDPRFFSGFWITAWLAPLAAVFLWKRRDGPGLWFAAFGFLAVIVPATVDFGPVFEHESFRWLFASGVGLAVAWGVTLPRWARQFRGKARWAAVFAALVFTWYCFLGSHKYLVGMQEAYRHPDQQHPTGLPRFMPDAPYLPAPYGQLAWQFKVGPADLEAARWLRKNALPGQSFAGNLAEWSANPKGALAGEARLPLYGHYHPLEDRDLRPPMYAPSPQSTAFWAYGTPDLLHPLGVDWLFVRTQDLDPQVLGRIDSYLKRAYDEDGVRVYEVPEGLRVPPEAGAPPQDLRVEGVAPGALEPGTAGLGTLRITNVGAGPVEAAWWIETRFRHRERDLVVNPEDPLRQRLEVKLAPGETVEAPWFLAAPYAGGDYLAEGPATAGEPPVISVREVTDEERFRNESAAPAGWR